MSDKVTIEVEMTEQEAVAFANFLKRAGREAYRPYANQWVEDDAENMFWAGRQIEDALHRNGIQPR
ncbi:hypothetical protein HBA55_34475 [Pseudomaricurvus alkylphenolicus]|uniref:DUF7706 family protein n=1 Tax=Pseudomaricurvus alkylphenolicus TaxID=1306991 RepID=UPI001421658E|nr:hypothetical protein [Pseudomaricurvus alkylphenolicus]NIB44737.1 hypothetical protein [Pseudomaricurvus alkylphenolicus]